MVADFEGFGRGMAANQSLDEGEVVVMVPRKMILNAETAYADEKLGSSFSILYFPLYIPYVDVVLIKYARINIQRDRRLGR